MLALLRALAVFTALLAPTTGIAAAAPKVGGAPPQYAGTAVDGAPVRLSDLRGKVIALSFWASWCEPCRKELPILFNLQRVAGAGRLQVIAVNSFDTADLVRKVRDSSPATAALLTLDPSGRVSSAFAVRLLPHLVLVDHEGRIAHIHNGYTAEMLDAILEEVNTLLDRQAAAPPAA